MKVTLLLATSVATAPDGTTFSGSYRYTVTGATQSAQDSSATSVDFDLDPGTYSAVVQAIDQNGNVFGPSASASFSVPQPNSFAAPASLTVSLG